MTAGFALESVLDVPFAPFEARGDAVDLAARSIAHHLDDDSTNFYRYLLWQLLRLGDRGQGDHWHTLHTMIRRAKADRNEGFARNAGALFVSRLKQWQLWEALRRTPPLAVGPAPNVN